MFEQATRQKLRFDSPKGMLSVEDLWDLPLSSAPGRTNLDSIALDLHRQLKGATDIVSFVDDTAKADPVIQLRFEIIKHVIATKKKENAEALAAREKAETKQRLLEVLAKKRDSSLEAMSEEDLLKRLAEL